MKAEDLDLRELLSFAPEGGVMTFAGERALLMNAVAMGLLRQQLIALLGQTAARGVLCRFGFSHGWRTAELLKDAVPWDTPTQWRIAGGRLHRLQGLVTFEPDERDDAFASACWPDSYEAEQHLLHIGLALEPICWTLSGFASGYLSRAFDERIYCVEESCVGQGDAVCRMLGKTLDDWGPKADAFLSFYEQERLEESLETVQAALKKAESQLQHRRVLGVGWDSEARHGIVARSKAMQRVVETARRVARVDTTVLITGESGVGKERVARLVHAESPRAGRAFVAINCGAVSEALLASELFGHKRGAFTGATQDRIGLFESAGGGTLFLDEVGELSQAMQIKLLRVLQERTIRRVGENRERAVDVRLVAATNRDMAQMVEAGRIRTDFYYRLRVVEICVAPLRDRPDDVLPLAQRFLSEISVQLGRDDLRGFSRGAVASLVGQRWPGNIRELRNTVERAVALSEGEIIDVDDLFSDLRPPQAVGPIGTVEPPLGTLAEVERSHVLAVLEACEGNRARAARVLGIGVATLYRKLKVYGVSR